jgi:hypothetical protein
VRVGVGLAAVTECRTFLLPRINWTKTLFFTEYLYYTMSLTETGNHRVTCNQGYETAYSVWPSMSHEAQHGIKIMYRGKNANPCLWERGRERERERERQRDQYSHIQCHHTPAQWTPHPHMPGCKQAAGAEWCHKIVTKLYKQVSELSTTLWGTSSSQIQWTMQTTTNTDCPP